ncbi:MAG TPA: helix-turn-helix transcriptional regulator [Chloroflexia bacterium]|nr:helix-turn-helix transcriptional regulator [Chloroflexia bacterium]
MSNLTKTISLPVTSLPSLGNRIRRMRQEKGMTQEALAGDDFTKGYVSALERGAVRPSLKALDIFANRLGVPITHFLSTSQEPASERDVKRQQEDFLLQCNYAKMLLRAGLLQEALQFIDELEQYIQPYAKMLPPDLAYMIPFLRGSVHLKAKELNLARAELETALATAKEDEEASARVRNLLGVAFLWLDLPQLAVEQHLECLNMIRVRSHATKDPYFRVSVYLNLANDYWALNEAELATGVYTEAVAILEELSDLKRQANLFWEMSEAHKASNDGPQAKLYGLHALHIHEIADSQAEAASICLNLAEIRIGEKQYEEATALLKSTGDLVAGTGNRTVMSKFHRVEADLARRQRQFETASQHAQQSIALAQADFEAAQSIEGKAGNPFGLSELSEHDPTRVYAEALHIEALIEEDRGNREAADRIFERALALVESPAQVQPAGQMETVANKKTRYAISLGYAKVLEARGEFEKAVSFYRVAAELQAHSMRRAI